MFKIFFYVCVLYYIKFCSNVLGENLLYDVTWYERSLVMSPVQMVWNRNSFLLQAWRRNRYHRRKKDSVIWVQILDEVVCVLLYADALGISLHKK